MKPRVLYRTHYQVLEPYYFGLIVSSCTSPTSSAYTESVAKRLVDLLKQAESDAQKQLNVNAGKYAVENAQALDLINDRNIWTDNGHFLKMHLDVKSGDFEERCQLSLNEKLAYFMIFLTSDGATLSYLAKLLSEAGHFAPTEAACNDVAAQMFVNVFSQYQAMTGNVHDQVLLRTEMDRIRSSGFTGKSGRHKILVHLHVLYRIGLLALEKDGSKLIYKLTPSASRADALTHLSNAWIPDVHQLEELVNKDLWLEAIASAMTISGTMQVPKSSCETDTALSVLADRYLTFGSTGVNMCPLKTIIESTRIVLLVRYETLVTYVQVLGWLQELQKQAPREVRFHVDRQGRPAFVKIDEKLVGSLKSAVKA